MPQLGPGQRWPRALAVLWAPTLHALPTEPQGWARGSSSSEGGGGRCGKPRCCSKRERGSGRGARGSAEPKETGSAQGCPCVRGTRRVRLIRRGDTPVTPGSGCTNSPRASPIKRWLLFKPLLDTKHYQVESTPTARGITSRQKLGMVELDSLWICLGICHLPLFV
ncbi:uncharacterized protein LOC120506222 [Passer montanus]|uniref:uncharacterized protein LOC120506222 n=1 Tax=Passer montanus TaxID=9160 RepID=UPI001960BEC2|nr:uncharacterized protein LOC120506222 [Passer montanus]